MLKLQGISVGALTLLVVTACCCADLIADEVPTIGSELLQFARKGFLDALQQTAEDSH